MDRKNHFINQYKNSFTKTTLLFLVGWILLFCLPTAAQNLIPNGDFETWNDTTNFRLYHDENYHPYIANWFTHTTSSTGINFFVFQKNNSFISINFMQLNNIRTNNGKGVGKLPQTITTIQNTSPNLNNKNFIQIKLTDSLQAGCYYQFDGFVLPEYKLGTPELINTDWLISNRLGFYFSVTRPVDTTSLPPYTFDYMNIVPQVALPTDTFISDTINFHHFNQVFQAFGGETYMTIGNFYPIDSTKFINSKTRQPFILSQNPNFISWSAFYVDDLSLTLIPPPDSVLTSIGDTVMCAGDSLTLFASGQHAQWYVWSTGSTDSTVIITQPGTYWVEAGFNCGFTKTDTIVVSPTPDVPPTTPNQDTTVCPNQPAVLFAPWQNAQNILWSTGQTDSVISVTAPGTYWVTALSKCGNPRADTIQVFPSEALPALTYPVDTTLCQGEIYTISLPVGPNYFVNNQPAYSHQLSFSTENEYTILMQNLCFQQQFTFHIYIKDCESRVFVPNAFSPNGDGINDCFAASVSKIQTNSYQIYIADRWGNIVFNSQNPDDCWEGFDAENQITEGVYTYRILYRDFDGKQQLKTGTIRLIL